MHSPQFSTPEETLFEHSESRLDISKFVLAGRGESGKDCGKVVMSEVDIGEDEDDVKAVKYQPLYCRRIECPNCYYEWAIRQTFDIAMKIETVALLRNERPFHVVFSIHPNDCRGMTWTDVNQKLWRRGVRRLQYIRCDKSDHNVKECSKCYTKKIRCKDARKENHNVKECSKCGIKKIRCKDAGKRGHRIEDCPDCWNEKIRCKGAGKEGHNVEDCPDCCDVRVRCGAHDHNVEDCPDCWDLSNDEYGGVGIFHPLRVRKGYQKKWGRNANPNLDIDEGSGRHWRKIREKTDGGKNGLSKYAKVGFHTHNWVFTDRAERQKNREYMIKFSRSFKRYSRKEVVALTRYLVTHTATIKELTVYSGFTCSNCGHSSRANYRHCNRCGHFDTSREDHIVKNRIVHPIRSYGLLHDFNPKRALIEAYGYDEGKKKYRKLAKDVADHLILRKEKGETITMAWCEETEELEYPAYAMEDTTGKEKANWVSIWRLLEMVRYDRFTYYLSPEKEEFVIDLLDYVENAGKPPPLEDCGRSEYDDITIPESVEIVAPIEKGGKKEKRRATVLRNGIIDVLKRCDDECVFGLEIYFRDYSMGEILGVLGYMAERGEVIQDGANFSLPISRSQRSKQIVLRG